MIIPIDIARNLVDAQSTMDRHKEWPAMIAMARALAKRNPKVRHKDKFIGLMNKVVFGLNDCWYFYGAHDQLGYGHYRHNRAHRLSWELFNGRKPNPLFVLHKCDVRCCINPDHLFLGTQKENMNDCKAKNRLGPRLGLQAEDNPMHRLTSEMVIQMRQVRAEFKTPYNKIAKQFNVSTMTAYRAITGKAWKTI